MPGFSPDPLPYLYNELLSREELNTPVTGRQTTDTTSRCSYAIDEFLMLLMGFLLTAIPFGYLLHRYLPDGAMRYVVCALCVLLVLIVHLLLTSGTVIPIIEGMLWGLLVASIFNLRTRG